MPTPSAAPFTMPANSASPELSAIVFCVDDQCLTVCSPARRPLRAWSAERAGTPQSPRQRTRGSQPPSSCQGKL
eukprot:4136463-Alexandrium_andersonii.AAC.1